MKENNLNKKNISDTDSPSTSSFQLKKTLVERLLNFGFLKNEGDTNSNNLKNLIVHFHLHLYIQNFLFLLKK